MDEITANQHPGAVRVTLGAPEYAIAPGKSENIEALLDNTGSKGDYFEVVVLGIPSSWITYSGPRTVWIPAGEQEKVIINVGPPAATEGVVGSHPGSLYVFVQPGLTAKRRKGGNPGDCLARRKDRRGARTHA